MTSVRTLLCAVFAASLLLVAGCSNNDKEPAVGPAQYQGAPTGPSSATTAPPTGPSTTGDSVPVEPEGNDEIVEAEGANSDHLEGSEIPFTAGTDLDVDRTDPAAVAQRWGCAYRAKPAGEDSDAWSLRLSPLMTSDARTKLYQLSSPADTVTVTVAEYGSAEIAPATAETGPTWRADCGTETRTADGKLVAQDAGDPVIVVLEHTDAGWAVADFAYGGIYLGAQ